MPSNAQQTLASGDGKVRCRIIHDDIPTDLCSKEQSAEDCEGCRAPTRRCLGCKKVRGIADAERGLCSICAADAGQVQRSAIFEGTPAQALTTVLDRVRSLATGKNIEPRDALQETAGPPEQAKTPATRPRPHGGSQQSEPKPSPHLDDPPSLFRGLMEHAVLRGGEEGIINAPISILMSRFHLLRQEAVTALKILAQEGYFDGKDPWQTVLLNRTADIKAIKARVETTRAQHSPEPRSKTGAKPWEVKPSPDASSAFCPQPKSNHEREEVQPLTTLLSVASLPSSKPLATYGEIYAHLKSRSNEVRGERVVGGALPMLQIRFKLNPAQAKESLEQLEAKGCIQRKDEWRTIRLVSPPTEGTNDGPARVLSQTTTGPKPPSKQPAVAAPRQPTPQGTVERTTKVVAPIPVGGTNWLSQSIALLEREISPLRKKRDDLGQRIVLLEAGLTILKKAEADLTAAKDGADASLTEVAQLVRRLLSHLPQK